MTNNPFQPRLRETAVGVRRRHDVRARDRDTVVPSSADSFARLEDHAIGVSFGDFSRPVLAPAVHDEDLELGPRQRLLLELPQEGLDPCLLMKCRDDDGNPHASPSRSPARANARRMHWSVLM